MMPGSSNEYTTTFLLVRVTALTLCSIIRRVSGEFTNSIRPLGITLMFSGISFRSASISVAADAASPRNPGIFRPITKIFSIFGSHIIF